MTQTSNVMAVDSPRGLGDLKFKPNRAAQNPANSGRFLVRPGLAPLNRPISTEWLGFAVSKVVMPRGRLRLELGYGIGFEAVPTGEGECFYGAADSPGTVGATGMVWRFDGKG